MTDQSNSSDLPPRLPALLFAHDVYKRALKAELESEGE